MALHDDQLEEMRREKAKEKRFKEEKEGTTPVAAPSPGVSGTTEA